MSETKTVIGTLAGIMEKTGDWRELHVAIPGKQYPVKMSTKKEELIVLARAAGDNVMEWTYTEKDSGKPNPHQPGTNFLDRYFEGVAPLTAEQQTVQTRSTPDSAPSGEGMSKDEWARKDRAGDLRACIAIAAGSLQHTLKSEPEDADLNEFVRRTLLVARQFHGVVSSERAGEDAVPFLSEHDEAIPY